ncbi:MAG: HEAT repeat domain-containing protein [Planctomycetota bacterium]
MNHRVILLAAAALALCAALPVRAVEVEEGDNLSVPQLRTVLLTGSIRGREAAATALAALRTPEAMAALFDGLADQQGAIPAAEALEKACKAKAEGMAPLLLPGLNHADYRSRSFTAYMLGVCADKAASAPVAGLLADTNFNVRIYAAEALRSCGDKAAVPALIKALKDTHPIVRLHAAAALGVIKDPSAIPALTAALADPTAAINAARALGAIGGAEAEAALLATIRDKRRAVAWSAISALGACGRKPSADALNTLAAETKDPRTARDCATAVAAIAGRTTP